MNRVLFSVAALLGALMPLVFDSALKGAALLVVATLCALLLCRASAATRHLVWLVAISALLAVPVLSVALPQWRVLPGWAVAPVVEAPSLAAVNTGNGTDATHRTHESHPATLPALAPQSASPATSAPAPTPAEAPLPTAYFSLPTPPPRTWRDWLAPAWAVGFTILALRLVAAHLLLRRAMRGCVVVRATPDSSETDGLAAQLHDACAQLGIRQRVTLLLDEKRTIPVVWGVFRPRLLLPAESLEWSAEQVRSVLLHELAHLKRRDTLVQWLTQIACALHWWNPLVWLAAWRLHVERERACDDLVLASGVRPSAYAEHLLHVATKLSPARWTAACGLAMARKSSLEGRLLAVLSEKLNRRGVTSALAAIALILGAGIAIPVAMLRAADEKKPVAPETTAATAAKPKHEYAQSLFRKWQASARTDGKIPGALIGHVAREVDGFLKQHPDDDKAPQLAALRPRLGASRDWAQAEVVALLDDITAISTAPVSWADIPMEFSNARAVQGGEALPIELTSAAWGAPMPNGLRAAWLLEPRAEQYALGSVLKARVLFHNTGKAPVVFKTETWHQADGHTARDAKGAEIKVGGSWFTGITPVATFRLAPGEYCEVSGHGIAIGAGKYEEEHSTGTVGAIIEAKEGDAVTLSHTVDTAEGGWTRPGDPKDPMELWKATIAERVANEAPMPASAADRAQLIRRVTLDILGVAPTAEEIAAFTADNAPDALAKLTARLQATPRVEPFAGKLPTGETKFRVIAADPHAAKAPRIANSPGRYVLGDNVHLLVSQLTEGDKPRTNKAVIAFFGPDPKQPAPHKPHEIALPDGIGTYGIVWDRGSGALWVMQKGMVRKYEFANPSQVQEMKIEPGNILNIPAHLQEAMKKAFDVPCAPGQKQMPVKPNDGADAQSNAGAKLERAMLEGTWEGKKNGVKVEVQFQWLSEHQQVRWSVQTRSAGIGAQMSVVLEPDGSLAKFVFRKGVEFEATLGRLTPSEGGTMRLEIIPNPNPGATEYPAVKDIILTRLPDEAADKAKTGAKLTPETEAQLDWGEAVNGLRAAVVVRSPQPDAAPGIFLAVQNVSAAALRFTDSMAAKEQRKLYLSDSEGILAAFTSSEPTKTDAVLPPRGVLFLPMFPTDLEKKGEAGLIEGIRKDSLQTWRAILNIENAPEGAWKGKLTTAETRGAVSADGPQPKNEAARALLKFWQRSARLNGDIPGGLLARLHDKVKEFIRNNTGDASGDPYAKKMAPLEPRFGPAGDWKPADVVALLDDIAAVTTIPLKTTLLHHGEHTLRHGQPLPATLEKADWGKPLDGGLRMAFLLEPRAAEYHLGTEVKARILLHNSGKEAVAFITRSFHQPGHKAHLADGGELKLDGTDWLTRSVPQAWRLAPGEYIEVNTPGLGIGAHDKERAEWSDVRAGSWILCSGGDEVTFLPGGIMLSYDDSKLDGIPRPWWPDFIAERLSREAPVPLDTTEREHLLYRVVRDLFGTAPSTTEGDAFAADKSPDALKNLAILLTKHQYGTRCEGPISAGETKFRVLPPDPDADKKPRVAMNPGRYTLGGYTTLVVTRRPVGRRIVNEAHLSYNPPGDTKPAPHHKIELPDGYDTWAVACVRGEKVLWLSQKGRLLKIDFTNFGKVQETRYEGDKTAAAPIPANIREALRAALTVPDAPTQKYVPLKPAAATPASPAASAPATEAPKTDKPKDGAGAKAPGDGEFVFITSDAQQPAHMLDTGDGVTLEIKRLTISQQLPRTVAILRWPARDGQPALEHGEQIATDGGGSPAKWAAAWKPGTKTVWIASRDSQEARPTFQELTFPDSKRITVKHISVDLKESHFPPAMPGGFRAKFGTFLGLAAPSGTAHPTYFEAQRVHAAIPADDKPQPGAVTSNKRFAEWRVKFEDRDTGKPVSEVLARLTIMDADSSERQTMLRTWKAGEPFWINFGADGVLKVLLSETQYASIIVEDEKLTAGGVPVSYFGNVPDSVNAGVKHTKVEEPFVVKLWPGTKKAPTVPDAPKQVQEPLKPAAPAPAAEKPKGAATKLTPDSLLGSWLGERKGERMMLSFHRPPVETDVQLDIYVGEATIGLPAAFTIATDGESVTVIQHSANGRVPFGTLRPGEAGTLMLELLNRQQGQTEVTLTRDADAPANEPRQAEARELFEMWKTTANADGTIPGTFIGALATEVRAYVKAKPNYDSAAKLPKLLPRFVTSRDWTQAEAIKLLDDVAYYSTEPISARVAKAKLPSGPMWRTMVEFQDIPVAIAKWGEAKDGLRMGLHMVGGQWSAGGKVRAELWLHNAGGKDVNFPSAGPNRQDYEVSFSAIDAEGKEHWPEPSPLMLIAMRLDCTLPAGHVAMVKEFDVTFADADNDVRTALGSRFRDLKPGKYQLRCKWATAWPEPARPDDRIKLTAPDFAFTLGGTTAEAGAAKPAPKVAKLPDDSYAKVGVAIGDVEAHMEWSGVEQDGLCVGMRIAEDAEWRIGGEVKVELWVCNPGEKDVKFQYCPRRDIGLRVFLKGADGKEHAAEIAQFRGYPVFSRALLPAGHIFKVKEFSVVLLPPDKKAAGAEPHFTLPAGDYKFRCEVKLPGTTGTDAEGKQIIPAEGEWTGTLKSGEFGVQLVAADAPKAKAAAADAKPEPVKVPDDQYVKAGFPGYELVGEGVMWNEVQNGMLLGYRITGDEWRILGKEVKVELWVQNFSDKDVKFQTTARPDIGLRMTLKDETGVKDAKEGEHESNIVPNDRPPFGELRLLPPRHALKVKEFTVSLLWWGNDVSGIKGHYFLTKPGGYKFSCELELPGFSATGEGGKQLTPAASEWTGKLTTSSRYVAVIAPDATAPKPRVEYMDVDISKDGEVSLFRKKMPLDELKTRAARNAKKRFTIRADKDVPYAKVVEVVDALKAAGVTEISFSDAQMGDGKYRVANRQAAHKLDDKHGFSMCRPDEYPQFFTVRWPAEGERPACWLRTYPNVSQETQGKWAVVWEPGTNVLWWVDDSDVGKMTVTDPMRVIVDREGRRNNFSRDFGLPDGVVTEFRRLGFEVGRDKTPGLENAIGGNTGGQSIVSAECGAWSIKGTVTDADGKPLADVPVRVTTNQELQTAKTDEKGNYRVYFSLPLQLLAHWRAVTVEPVLEGFTERDMAKAGQFNALLHAGEQPQRVRIAGDKDFQPGPIPRFAERDLIPSQPGASPGNPGRADFVMLKAGEITGEIVTADGKPAPPHFIAAATPEQRPGHNAAIEKSDAQGHFRLKGIPTNKPVIFTVNPDGKPGETSKSSEQKFEQTGAPKIRIILPAEGSGKGPVKIERLIEGASAAASGAIRGKVLKPDGSPAAGVQVRVDDGIERWKFRGPEIPDLPRTVTTAADGTFSIEVPKGSVATNYEAFASSEEFAPLNAKVPAGGYVGVMHFAIGSRVTGRVFGLDGAGLAKVGIWCKRLDWKGRGPAPAKLTATGADGTFSVPSIATGRHVLQILTRDLGAKELTVAFANHVIEAKDDAPVAVEIRPLPTVNLTLDVRVLRGKPEFPDFELRVSGTLPGHKAGEPASYWTRQETTKLREGKHTMAVPAGLQKVQVRADRIYMRKGDDPAFLWQRAGVEKRKVGHMLELGVADKPQTIGLPMQDAAM